MLLQYLNTLKFDWQSAETVYALHVWDYKSNKRKQLRTSPSPLMLETPSKIKNKTNNKGVFGHLPSLLYLIKNCMRMIFELFCRTAPPPCHIKTEHENSTCCAPKIKPVYGIYSIGLLYSGPFLYGVRFIGKPYKDTEGTRRKKMFCYEY